MTTKFYQEDIVQRIDDPTSYGVVLRCWHDPDEIPLPPAGPEDPLLRNLEPGEVGVSFFPSGHREILLESQFQLVDRAFQGGDIVKRNINDVRSGIVLRTQVKARLEHAISGEPLAGWTDATEVIPAMDVEMGDYVIHADWVGQVIELFDEALVQLNGGQLVRMPELSTRLSVGEKGSDIIPQSPTGISGFFGFLNPPTSNVDTVIAMRHTVLAVSWLAINQALDPAEAQSQQRPRRIWHGPDISQLTQVRYRAGMLRVGEKVLLKQPSDAPLTKHGKEGEEVEVRHLVVRESRTTVTVLWQDNIEETVSSAELIPHLNPDEYECWPGDPVVWKSDSVPRPAIVQSVNPADRTAYIKYLGEDSEPELASLLELDPHGNTDPSSQIPLTDDLGVHRGDCVFIHRFGTTNGAPHLRVPRIGELEGWVREMPTFHQNGQISGWRKEMSDIGASIASARSKEAMHDGLVQRVRPGNSKFNWFGEVTNLHMDGTVEVTLPDSSIVNLPLERLTRLYDGLEQLEDIWGDEMSEGQDDTQGMDGLEYWGEDGGNAWQTKGTAEAGDWEDDESLDTSMEMELDGDEPSAWDDIPSEASPLEPFILDSATSTPVGLDTPPRDHHSPSEEVLPGGAESSNWKRFEVLASAPADHAFYSTTPSQPSRQFLGRLSKEYRALSNSLPDSIIVRAFEDRSDLLRSLIFGSENTPYEDAPFVIDWMLDANFPNTPPIAHFMSWTNGNGRVNPNLYEEGKVCLSILGTWAGDKNETWNAARSSLLQAFVSIQGLVLVKEPYFCEPAYEKFRNTEEGAVNSRLYNEKAYVLSRGFILRALELQLGGLHSELDWMYFTNGKLDKVLQHSEALIERSKENQEEDRDLAIPRLTAGGIISLQRVLNKLKAFCTSRNGT